MNKIKISDVRNAENEYVSLSVILSQVSDFINSGPAGLSEKETDSLEAMENKLMKMQEKLLKAATDAAIKFLNQQK